MRHGRRSVTAQAIRWEKAVKRVNENALKMKRQSEQNELHSYEIDERLSVSETQATEIEKRLSRMQATEVDERLSVSDTQATEFLKAEFKSSTTSSTMTTEQMMARMQELVNRVQQAEARAGQAEQQAEQTQQVLAKYQQQQQKSQMKGGNSFASKYQADPLQRDDRCFPFAFSCHRCSGCEGNGRGLHASQCGCQVEGPSREKQNQHRRRRNFSDWKEITRESLMRAVNSCTRCTTSSATLLTRGLLSMSNS